MVVDLEATLDILKSVPVTLWMLSSVILLSTQLGPVNAVHEFTAHRMQQFDLYGIQYGSRGALVNMEARGEQASMLNRKCVIVRWAELSIEKFLEVVERGAGSILILLPPDMNSVNEELIQEWRDLEADLLSQKVSIPVYFAEEDANLSLIYRTISDNAARETKSSAVHRLLSIFDEDGYQMISGDQKESQPDKNTYIHTVTGKLVGSGMEHRLPTLAILAHYDTIGLATSVPTNAGVSGVAAVLEMARLFSRLYSDPKLRPKHNLLFILSGGGKLNYFGTKHLIFDQIDNQEENGLLPEAEYTLCLDEVAGGDELFVHVSKPPKEGSRPHQLLNALNMTRVSLYPDTSLPLVHKKVRLSDDLLAWEHEQFSLKRLPASTLSSLESHTDKRRRSMFIQRSKTDLDVLSRNVKIISEGVARHLYGLICENTSDCGEVFDGGEASVHPDYLRAWVEFLSGHARSPQLLNREHPVVTGLEQGLERYTQDVSVYSHKPETSDPEFVAYNIAKIKMQAHRIKPALFDLFLGLAIAAYGFFWYFSVQYFPIVWPFIQSLPFPVQVRTFKLTKLE